MKKLNKILILCIILCFFCGFSNAEQLIISISNDSIINELFTKGLYEQAVKILQNQKQMQSKNGSEAIKEVNKQVIQLKQNGEWQKAIQEYEQVIKALPNSHDAVAYGLNGIAKIYREKKEYNKALDIYNELLKINYSIDKYDQEKGISLSLLGEVETRWKIAECQTEQENYNEAVKEYKTMIKLVTLPENYDRYSKDLKVETSETVKKWKEKIKEISKLKQKVNRNQE